MEMNEVLCLKWNNHKTIFLQNLSSLRTQELYSDATITCNGKFFSVHRLVLSTCSEYFEEIFERINMQSIHPFIIVTNIESGYLEALLNFMYNGEVNVLHEMLPGLIKAAEVLKIKGLAVPDEQIVEKEIIYAHEREANTVDPDGHALHSVPSSSPNSSQINQSLNENLPNASSILNENIIHSEKNISDVQNDGERDEIPTHTNSYNSKEEIIEMYPIESPNEYGNANQEILLRNENENEIKLENDQPENQMESTPTVASNLLTHHSPPQQISSVMVSPHTSSYVAFSQDNINAQESVQCCPIPLDDVCGKEEESEVDFAIDHSSAKENSWIENANSKEESSAASVQDVIHGFILQSESDNTYENGVFLPSSPRHLKHSNSKCEDSPPQPKPKIKKRNSSSSSAPLSPTSKKCPKCPYVTKYVSTLRRHIMFKHTGEKPHQCHYCPYRSAHNFNMKKHMMIHTGEKPFSCPLCPYKAAQNSNIKAHMKSHEKKLLKAAIRGTKREKQ